MTISIDAVYLNAADLLPSVASVADNTVVKISDDGSVVDTNPRWDRPKRKWALNWINASSVEQLFYTHGNHTGFLFLATIPDRAADYIASGQALGIGDGSTTAFQLTLTTTIGTKSVSMDVLYPISGTVVIYVNGVPTTPASISYTTGVVTMSSAPAASAAVTADFHFAWPVRFVSEAIDVSVQTGAQNIRSVMIEEVF